MNPNTEKTKATVTEHQAMISLLKNKRRLKAILKDCSTKDIESIKTSVSIACDEIQKKHQEIALKKSKLTDSLNHKIAEFKAMGYTDSEIKEVMNSLIN